MTQYDIILQKLDAFIRKYYTNQLIRGGLIFLGTLLLYVLLVTIGEYFFYFSVQVKWSILAFFIAFASIALIIWVIVPLSKIRKLGKIISHEQAALIIGNFFPDVADKLLNVLQLKKQPIGTFESKELLEASIDQKAAKIAILPFGKAVNFGKNKKYLPLILIPILSGAAIFFIAPKIFTEAGLRLAQPSVFFAKPAPFEFVLLNKNLQIVQGQSITIKAQFKGNKIPNEMYIDFNGAQILMKPEGKNSFAYTINQVEKALNFRLYAADYYTEQYTISVLQKPALEGMQLLLSYPTYTQKEAALIQGLSDVNIPIGTTLTWKINANHTDKITVIAGDIQQELTKKSNQFTGALRFLTSMPYQLVMANNQGQSDTLLYNVQVIEDQFPQVSIQVLKDSTLAQQILISGTAGDDYLIRQNLFTYQILDGQQKVIRTHSTPLKSGTQVVQFAHYFDIGTLKLSPGQEVNYFVEVWDNDAINGSKSRRSEVMQWKAPSINELDKTMNENAEKMNASMSTSAAQAENLKEEYKEMQKELMNESSSNWERQQKMQSMLDKNLQIQQNLENLKKRFEEQAKQTEAKNLSQDVKEKQEALKEQIDNLKDKQLAEQIKKLQELLQQKNPQDQMEQMKQMEQMNKLFQMDMERLQELSKKLEMQINLEQLAKQLDQLAQKQDALEKATEKGEKSNEALAKEQDALKKELEKLLKEKTTDIKKQNEKLEKKEDLQKLEELEDEGEDAGEDMKNASDNIKMDNKSDAQKAQKKAKNKLAKMSESLMKMSGEMEMEQIEIDIKATRQLLTNLIRFSFDQEKLMDKLRKTSANSPQYLALTKEQNRLKNNTEMIKDSLFSLSKRIFKIAATINKETTDLDNAIEKAIRGLEARNYNEFLSRQQYAMTASNNLALLLNELLANLMQQQSGAGSGGGSGSGGGKGNDGESEGKGKGKGKGSGSGSGMMKDIITGQQEMGKGMQGLNKGGNQSGQGQQPGGQQGQGSQGGGNAGNAGGSSGSSGQGDQSKSEGEAERIARLAQQQALLRKQLQELNNLLNSNGIGGAVSKEIRDIQAAMDKMETDLVYRRNADELMKRNKEILTRMLEAEKAIQEQEEDDKRSAQAGKDLPRPMPAELSEHLKKQQQLLEQYRKTMPALKPFYQKMADEYLRKVQTP